MSSKPREFSPQVTQDEAREKPRERNKLQKRDRIRSAALDLFSRRGYEATTLRDVAHQAGVALGTVSLYARDKRDLTLLVFNEQIGRVTSDATAAAWAVKGAPLLDRLIAFFGAYYRDFDRNHTLARIMLQLNYYSTGIHGPSYHELRSRVASELEAMVRAARDNGEIADGEPSELVARHFFFVFSAAVRWWIAGANPRLVDGLGELRKLLQIQIAGLRCPSAASTATAKTVSRKAVKPAASLRSSKSVKR